LNGSQAKCVRFDDAAGRWALECASSGEFVNVKPVNLQPAPAKAPAAVPAKAATAKLEAPGSVELTVGQRIVFQGLAGRADLNGTFGKLVKFDADAGRWAVQRERSSELVNVRPANLQVVSGSGASSSSSGKMKKIFVKPKMKSKMKAKAKATVTEVKKTVVKEVVLGGVKGKKPQKPKRALSAYMLFCNK
jgi:hypothetical protein